MKAQKLIISTRGIMRFEQCHTAAVYFRISSLVLIGGVLAAGCSADTVKLAPGKCRENTSSDCGPGFKCNGTNCEDIYFPRRDVINY